MSLEDLEAKNARERAALADKIALELMRQTPVYVPPKPDGDQALAKARAALAMMDNYYDLTPAPKEPKPKRVRVRKKVAKPVVPPVAEFLEKVAPIVPIAKPPSVSAPFEHFPVGDLDKARQRAAEGIW